MKKTILTILGILVLCIAGYFIWQNSQVTEDDNNIKSEVYNASLRFGWIPSASFAGEITGMNMFSKENQLNLKCETGGPGLNAIQLVQTGQDTFGTIAADEVLAANDKGADFVIIGVINYFSPGGFVAMKGSGIMTPKDFEGKRVGLLPFGSTNLLYESMLEKNNVDRSKIEEIIVSPDLRPFILGKYDVHPVFVYDETVTLDMNNVDYNLIEPKDFGVKFKGPVYFCKRETLEKNPQLVRAFINTMAEGWNYAISHPKEAISFLKDFAPEIDTIRESKVFEKAIPYYSAYKGQPLNSDYESWDAMINELKRQEEIKKEIDIKNVVKLEFIQDFYSHNE